MEAAVLERRADAIADPALGGRDLCRRLAAVTDDWLRRLFADAVGGRSRAASVPSPSSPSVGTVGASWRHRATSTSCSSTRAARHVTSTTLAGAMWYPLWDSGVRLGHAVRSFDEQLAIAARDLDSATALLTARWVAGDEDLAARLATEGRTTWRRNGRRWLETSARQRPRPARPGR